MKRPFLAAALAAIALTSCGGQSHDAHASNTSDAGTRVQVDMTDFAFSPSAFTFARGTTVTFVFRNRGQTLHEAMLGDEAAQESHEMTMTSDSAMHDMHSANQVEVAAGKTASLRYTFDRVGSLLVGCHQPGHYGKGMKATITVR